VASLIVTHAALHVAPNSRDQFLDVRWRSAQYLYDQPMLGLFASTKHVRRQFGRYCGVALCRHK
jgi:hypothetical protein